MPKFQVPVGLATKLGVLGTALLAFTAALAPLFPGAGAPESKFFAALASVVGIVTIIGRMLQAAAQTFGANSTHTAKRASPPHER